ncbi:MAG TPA: hypothetical protein VLX92_13670 [Kofleriaceae bacterium]|nr:hypothetical protein [Kofleriaceae bacterium]
MRTLVWIVLAIALPAGAAPLAASDVTGKPLPKGVSAHGATIDRVMTFSDKNGVNYVVFSWSKSDKPPVRSLFVDHWVVPASGAPRALLPVRDFVEDCYMNAATATFVDDAFGVTDLDGNGIAEVTYGYQLACRSDVRPATYKLLMVQNGAKYILRGSSRIDEGGEIAGGEFKADPASSKWPAGFLAHATELWNRTDADADIH